MLHADYLNNKTVFDNFIENTVMGDTLGSELE
jgi:hypothetical protein